MPINTSYYTKTTDAVVYLSCDNFGQLVAKTKPCYSSVIISNINSLM